MTSSGAAENFFASSMAVRGTSAPRVNADCKHCGEIIAWVEGLLQWCLVDATSQYRSICRVRYEQDGAWAVVPTLVHEPNTDLPDTDSVDDLEKWLES